MISALGGAPLAAIRYRRGFDVDDLLFHACARLQSSGLRIGGLLQRTSGDRGRCASSIHVVDLRSGQSFDIWESRGACAVGCRLDERGLVAAETTLMAALADGVDLLIINRFGRAESLGRGLVSCFSAATEAGVAVLTAVRPPYGEAWDAFHGGCAHELRVDVQGIFAWAIASTPRGRALASAGQHAALRTRV